MPSISEAEWKVMKLLWRKAPQPAYDLAQQLCQTEPWHPRTVKTMLNRLVNKGVLAFEPYKNLYLYRPKFSEEECVMQQSESFLKRVFNGSVSLMLVQFVRNKKLSPSEIRKLREILNHLGD